MALTFNRNYFGLATLLFIVEVIIALFVRDRFIRPYLGDVLVVIMIHCFVRAFLNAPIFAVALAVLAFAFGIEFLQSIHLVQHLGLDKSVVARTVLGTGFEWFDLMAYMAGIGIVLLSEKYFAGKEIAGRA